MNNNNRKGNKMSEDLPNPESREELYLAKAAGESVEVPTPNYS